MDQLCVGARGWTRLKVTDAGGGLAVKMPPSLMVALGSVPGSGPQLQLPASADPGRQQ